MKVCGDYCLEEKAIAEEMATAVSGWPTTAVTGDNVSLRVIGRMRRERTEIHVACAAAAAATITTTKKNKKKGMADVVLAKRGTSIDVGEVRRGASTAWHRVVSVEDVGGSVDDCERVPISSKTIHEISSFR
ncbi:hypothetical protein WUBG_11860 [Wuchereria bancrofti]|uniref:Uncharacterized protein n=1 Tax=Wuchereria bancrofti TaxID=6293 RepID=J9E4N0_WUCBA|nr:hypothetical protein WUBG_11860 [Wuchereria bancrofti]